MDLSREELLDIYHTMQKIRLFESKVRDLAVAGEIPGFVHVSIGEEATHIGAAYALRPTDWFYPAYREVGAALYRGYALRPFMCQLFGNAEDPVRGRQMPVHHSIRKLNFVSISSPVGTQIPHAVGTAWAAKLQKKDDVAVAFFGEGGSSTPILMAEEIVDAPDEKSPNHAWHGKSVLDVPLGVDTFRHLGTMLGTCCATVMAEGTDPIAAFHNLMQFYRHESCGQCTPCREGTGWANRVIKRILNGQGKQADIDMLLDVVGKIEGHTICAFGDAAAWPVQSFIKHFRHEFEYFVAHGRSMVTGEALRAA